MAKSLTSKYSIITGCIRTQFKKILTPVYTKALLLNNGFHVRLLMPEKILQITYKKMEKKHKADNKEKQRVKKLKK